MFSLKLLIMMPRDSAWKFEPAEGQSVLSWPQKRETGGTPDDKVKLWIGCRERESSKISHCMVTVLMSSASYLGHYEKKINKVFWKYWSPCEPWLTTPTKNQMKLEGLKQNMKGTAFLLYLWQQQADTVIWAPWCLVILDIQLSADLSSTRLAVLRIWDHLFNYPFVLAVQSYLAQNDQFHFLLRYLS